MDTRNREAIDVKKREQSLSVRAAWLKRFFAACDRREKAGAEPDWEQYKRLLTGNGGKRWT
jgi:hypothetical protein